MANRRTGRKERVCPWCSLNFTKDDHLERHIRTHTKDRPFSCLVCGKSFTRHDSLLRHSRSHVDSRRRSSQAQPVSRGNASQSTGPISTLLNPQPSVTGGSPESYKSTSLACQASPSPPSTHRSQPTHSMPSDYPTLDFAGMPNWARINLSHPVEPSSQVELAPELDRLETDAMDTANPWIFSPSNQIPGWLVREDFDMNALNAHILPSSIPLDSFEWSSDGYMAAARTQHVENIVIQSPSETDTEPKEEYIRRHWFTYLGSERSGHITPDAANERTSVDEKYREDLSRELQHRVNNEPLPSTDFLNLCIQMYFTRFHPTFPIVHAPTFQPSAKRSLLLLSICSIGSLFLGSSFAVAQGVRIFEQLNKAILASWESYIVRGAPDALAMTQAALIGQTFGMLSGNPRHIAIVQSFHGSIIAWARKQNMFDQDNVPSYSTDLLQTDLEASWRRWVHHEEKKRVALGLRIHDAELAELFTVEPFLRISASKRPSIACDDAWLATTAVDWARSLNKHNQQHPGNLTYPAGSADYSAMNDTVNSRPNEYPLFALYVLLEGQVTYVMDRACTNPMDHASAEVVQFLISIYDDHLRQQKESDPFSLKALWHSIFISLYCNVDKLECAAGREGVEKAQALTEYATTWASSSDGHRCAIHAALILQHLERIPIGEEPAIHVPRLLWRASLVWYAYTRFGRDENASAFSASHTLEFPELTKAGIDGRRVLFVANGFKKTRPATADCSTLFHLIDLLTRLGHWGISQKIASLSSLLVYGRPRNDPSG